jgi:polyhydroxybutyrate depolymerase
MRLYTGFTVALLLLAGCRLNGSSEPEGQQFQPANASQAVVSRDSGSGVQAVAEGAAGRAAEGAGAAPPTATALWAAGSGGVQPSGPGKTPWTAGDYPDDITSANFLKLSDLDGQRGVVRQYKVHVPASYRPDQPTPLVFCLHGLFQDTTMFCVSGSGLVQLSDQVGFIVVMPLGHSGSWNAGRCCGDARDMKLDDVAFIRGIFEELKQHLNIALDRVYGVGFANGGFMTYRLACEAADIFAALAIGSGGLGINAFQDVSPSNPDLLISQSNFEKCEPSRPVPFLHIHGSLDELVPSSLQSKSLAHLAAAAGCSTNTSVVTAHSQGDTTCSAYDGCPNGLEITGCTVKGGGHCWFGQDDCGTGVGPIGALFTGANSSVMRNSEAIIEFLRSHGL